MVSGQSRLTSVLTGLIFFLRHCRLAGYGQPAFQRPVCSVDFCEALLALQVRTSLSGELGLANNSEEWFARLKALRTLLWLDCQPLTND